MRIVLWRETRHVFQDLYSTGNKTAMQLVSRLLEQVLSFSKSSKNLPKSDVIKTVKVWKQKEKGCEKVFEWVQTRKA